MTPEDKLKAVLAAGRPRTPDHAFQAAVAERVARRQAWRAALSGLPWAVGAGAVLWLLKPSLESGLALDALPTDAGIGLAASALTLALAAWLTRRVNA